VRASASGTPQAQAIDASPAGPPFSPPIYGCPHFCQALKVGKVTLLAGSRSEPCPSYREQMTNANGNDGILVTVPGEYISAASRDLPDPATATAGRMTATIDAGWVGLVRITYERRFTKHHKMSHWYWGAVSAEPIRADGR
jgi:hypothetical protein